MRHGFALLEVIFAAFILSLTCLAVLTILPGSILAEKRAQNRMAAEALALADLERARVIAFGSLDAAPARKVTLNQTEFTVLRTVTLEPPRLKKLRVTASWEEAGWTASSARREIVMEGYVVDVRR